MNKNFNKLIQDSIQSNIESFLKVVSSNYKINYTELLNLWKGVSSSTEDSEINFDEDDDVKIPEVSTKETKPKTTGASDPKKRGASPKSQDVSKCQYKSTKGKNEGELCGTKVSDESKSGLYCKKHLKQETEANNSSAKKVEKPKTKTVEKDQPKITSSYIEKKTSTFNIVKNKFGNYWNEATCLVFDKETKRAIGKQSEDGKIIPLTKQDIETCKNNNLPYKTPDNIISSSVQKDDDNEEDDEDIEDDEDEFDEDELED